MAKYGKAASKNVKSAMRRLVNPFTSDMPNSSNHWGTNEFVNHRSQVQSPSRAPQSFRLLASIPRPFTVPTSIH